MAEITMCVIEHNNCPLRYSCYRFTAPPAYLMQSWQMPQWDGEKCDDYIDNGKEDVK